MICLKFIFLSIIIIWSNSAKTLRMWSFICKLRSDEDHFLIYNIQICVSSAILMFKFNICFWSYISFSTLWNSCDDRVEKQKITTYLNFDETSTSQEYLESCAIAVIIQQKNRKSIRLWQNVHIELLKSNRFLIEKERVLIQKADEC